MNRRSTVRAAITTFLVVITLLMGAIVPVSAASALYQSESTTEASTDAGQSVDAKPIEAATEAATGTNVEQTVEETDASAEIVQETQEVSEQLAPEIATEPASESTEVQNPAPMQAQTVSEPQQIQAAEDESGDESEASGGMYDSIVCDFTICFQLLSDEDAICSGSISWAVNVAHPPTSYDLEAYVGTTASGSFEYLADPYRVTVTDDATVSHNFGNGRFSGVILVGITDTNGLASEQEQITCGVSTPPTDEPTETPTTTPTDEPGYSLDITWDNCQVTVTPHGDIVHLGIVTLNGVELQGRLYVKDGVTTILYDEDDLKNGDAGFINGEPFGPVTGCDESTPTATVSPTTEPTETPTTTPTGEPGEPSCASPISYVDGTAPNIADIHPGGTFHVSFQLQGGTPDGPYPVTVSLTSFQNGVRYSGQTVEAVFNDDCVADIDLTVEVPPCNFRIVIALGPSPEKFEDGYAHARMLMSYEGPVKCEDNGTPAPTEQPTEPPASPTSEPTNPPATPTDDGTETPVDEGQTGNDSDNGSDAGVDQSQSSPAEKIVSGGSESVSTELGASQNADAGTAVTAFPTTGSGPEDDSANLMIIACWILSIVAAAAAVLLWRKEPRKAYQRW